MAAAVCEINNCGVLAIGRCAHCGKAFCRSHQARYDPINSITLGRLDLTACCQKCLTRMEADRADWAADAMRQVQEATAYFSSGTAQAEFRARGVPSVELLAVSKTYRERLGGLLGGGLVEHVASAGRGWLLGEFTWKSTTFQFGEHTVNSVKALTVLIDRVTPTWSGSPVTTVSKRGAAYTLPENYWNIKPPLFPHLDDGLAEWEAAYRAAKKLVET